METNLKTQSGNRIVIEFDGREVGLLQTCRGDDNYAPEPASGIGDIHTQEWVPTRAAHTLSFSKMVLITEKMRSSGMIPENGDAVLKGLVYNVVYYSRDSGMALKTYTGCSYASGSVDVSAHRITVINGTLNALDTSGTGI